MKLEIVDLLEKLNLEYNGKFITKEISSYTDKLLEKASIDCVVIDNRIIGFIAYYDNDIKKEKAFLSMIAVLPEFAGKGYGKELIEKAIGRLKEKGFKFFELEVLKSNDKAIKFYEKFNFKIIKPVNDFKYLMLKDLLYAS